MKNKKIVCISDMHGYLPEEVPDGDILLIGGDICPIEEHKIDYQAYWVNEEFNPWLKSLPFDSEHIAMVAGNHDFVFDKNKELLNDLSCKYLEESEVIIDGVKIYGYPHCPKLANWAFYRMDSQMEECAEKIPDDTDILLTHCPPYSILDSILDGPYKSRYSEGNKYLGCSSMMKRVNNIPDLKLHVFGHIHTSHGVVKPNGLGKNKTTFVNASIMDDWYKPVYDIITVEI